MLSNDWCEKNYDKETKAIRVFLSSTMLIEPEPFLNLQRKGILNTLKYHKESSAELKVNDETHESVRHLLINLNRTHKLAQK